jgi:phytoene dehydrogenase-like protein
MPTNSYDLIVVGDDLAGLVAAALCARRGMRTLVVTPGDRPPRYALGPHKLPIEAMIWAGRGGAAADRVIRELHLEHDLRRRLRDARTTAQLVGPDLRIDLASDAQALARELARELPTAERADAARLAWEQATEVARAADGLVTGATSFPGQGFMEGRAVRKLAERAAGTAQAWASSLDGLDEVSAALLRLPAVLGARAGDPAPLAIARAADAWRAGAPGLRGDGDGLRELLVDKLEHASGEVRVARVAELPIGWGKVSSVVLDSGEELGAGQVIAALPVAELIPLLGKKPPKKLVELSDRIVIAGWRYTLNLVVDGAGVPEGMAQTLLAVTDARAPLTGANAFAIHAGEPDDAGRVIVTIQANLPATDSVAADADAAPPPPQLAALRAELVRALDDIMPFVANHLVVAHSPHQDVAPEVPGGRGGHEAPKSLPVPMRPLWRADALDDSASCALADYDTGIKNLTIASTQVLPHLGLEGDFAAGWSAAKEVCGLAGKKKDYLRDEILGAQGS